MRKEIIGDAILYRGDCLDVLPTLELVDSVVTDPPYGLNFMGRGWDHGVPGIEYWQAVMAAMKPGAHLLAFGGTRTYHRLTCAIEDAGFEIRDCIMWVYGCLSEDTEILTINGWERYHKTIGNHPVLCYNIDSDEFEFQKPIKQYKYENKHPAYRIQSDHTDQIVSRNHRCIVERDGRKQFVQAETLEREENIPFLENLSDLPESIYNSYTGTSIKKQILLELCRERDIQIEERGKDARKTKMPELWRTFLSQISEQKKAKSLLLKKMQRRNQSKTFNKAFPQGAKRMDRSQHEVLPRENDRSKQPCVEGWSNLFQKTWELFTNKISKMPRSIFSHGPKRRLHNGASVINGTIPRQVLDQKRGGPSHKSQSSRQPIIESDVISEQSGTQTVRITKSTITRIEYDGFVWCVEVPWGAFVARRNGKIFITGNSGFPKSLNIGKAIDKTSGKMGVSVKNLKIELIRLFDKCGKTRVQIDKECGFRASNYLAFDKDGKQPDPWVGILPSGDKWNKIKKVIGCDDEMDDEINAFYAEAEREILETKTKARANGQKFALPTMGAETEYIDIDITAPATPEAQQWDGWGTALKPAWEPIIVARKPFKGTVAANVLEYGTGGINIDACRVETIEGTPVFHRAKTGNEIRSSFDTGGSNRTGEISHAGRFPANLIHDGSDEVTGLFPITTSGGAPKGPRHSDKIRNVYGIFKGGKSLPGIEHSVGTAARFFYCAKTSRRDRNEGMDDPGPQFKHGTTHREIENANKNGELKGNTHPTVKPTALMQYLCKLVTPPGGIVLDPFMGSGSTGKAALLEGFKFAGIDNDNEEGSFDTACQRIRHASKNQSKQLELVA